MINSNLFAMQMHLVSIWCSDANASGVLILSFQSLKNDADMWESFPPPGRVTATLGTNV